MTVFERDDAIGGLLQYGIPTMKLSRAVVQRRIRLLEQEGIHFQTGVNVGKDISAKVCYYLFNILFHSIKKFRRKKKTALKIVR